MKHTHSYDEPNQLTLGELCLALADKTLQAKTSEGYYMVKQQDLLRFARARTVSRAASNIDTGLLRYFTIAG